VSEGRPWGTKKPLGEFRNEVTKTRGKGEKIRGGKPKKNAPEKNLGGTAQNGGGRETNLTDSRRSGKGTVTGGHRLYRKKEVVW